MTHPLVISVGRTALRSVQGEAAIARLLSGGARTTARQAGHTPARRACACLRTAGQGGAQRAVRAAGRAQHAVAAEEEVDADAPRQADVEEAASEAEAAPSTPTKTVVVRVPLPQPVEVMEKGEGGDIQLCDPLDYIHRLTPLQKDWGESIISETVPTKTGDFILFPGWITHGLSTKLTDSKRISISWNSLINTKDAADE